MPGARSEPTCSIELSLQVLGERWTFLILREALEGATRYSEFQERLGIASDLLSRRLQTLVDAGVMERREYRENGARARASYHLTAAGEELRVALGALQAWGDEHRIGRRRPTSRRVDRKTGRALSVAFVDDRGRAVDIADVDFEPTDSAA